ncbi:hypothetical protein [Microbispora hainanensis]|uniref:Uncharacterized protein n=1 Tax=Microbispora hainanensis TaxID=568844 RepID=A0ABZ1SR29_9ACTN|nr:hypothetical protein [Microbispora hainanensis]
MNALRDQASLAKGETHHAATVPQHRQDAPAHLAPEAGSSYTAADAGARPAVPPVGCPTAGGKTVLYVGKTTASYFWDDGSGVNGDTGAPASGEPMQKGLAASPSWPMGTKGYVIYQGKKADFFIGDRGPGIPSSSGVMLDLDGKTFADLTGGTWDTGSYTVDDAGGLGHIPVTYVITEWGDGLGKTGAPRPFSSGAYGVKDHPKPPPPCPTAAPAPSATQDAQAAQDSAPAPGVKESPAPVASSSSAPAVPDAPAESAVPVAAAPPAPPAPSAPSAPPPAADSPGTQAEAAAAQMFPLSGGAAANAGTTPATLQQVASKPVTKTVTETVKGARYGGGMASPAFIPASAVDGQADEAVPAFSVAIVVCALVAVGAKAVLSRPAHAAAHHPGRHRKR